MNQNCNTLQHTATHCNGLQHPATQCNRPFLLFIGHPQLDESSYHRRILVFQHAPTCSHSRQLLVSLSLFLTHPPTHPPARTQTHTCAPARTDLRSLPPLASLSVTHTHVLTHKHTRTNTHARTHAYLCSRTHRPIATPAGKTNTCGL